MLSCQLPVDLEKFKELCTETAKIFIEKYEWYNMPATVHTILIHATEIMMHAKLPVGVFGEEGLESSNKVNKSSRLHHARTNSRLNTIADIFHRRMDSSDPLLSSQQISKLKKPARKIFPQKVHDLILLPTGECELNDTNISQQFNNFYEELDDIEVENELDENQDCSDEEEENE